MTTATVSESNESDKENELGKKFRPTVCVKPMMIVYFTDWDGAKTK